MSADNKMNTCVLIAKPIKWFLFPLLFSFPAVSFSYYIKPVKPKALNPGAFLGGKIPFRPLPHFSFSPPDTTITACGSSLVLQSKTVAGYSNLTWDNGSSATTRTVTASGTYWWQVIGTNVVTNGDFSAGNTGFTSSYTNKTTNNPNGTNLFVEGTYAVDVNPNAYHTSFTQFGDHTTGSGKMLIVNGASVPNVTVWKQNITILANTDYVFSVWATSATPTNPAILQFSINGSPLGSTITPSASLPDGTWQYFTATWNSGATSGSVPIALVNQNIIASGNDFAIDDIVFAPVYRQNVIVDLNPIPVLTLTGPNSACGLYDLAKTINGYDATTYSYQFKDSSGHVLASSAVTQSGTYTIIETNKTTGCQSLPQTTTLTINPIPTKPGITSL